MIALYKGWSSESSARWGNQWTQLALLGQQTDDWSKLDAFEKTAGIKIASYNGQGNTPETDILNLQGQMEGFKDITLVGYSKGANLVENYMAYKAKTGFSSGPNVEKFVIAAILFDKKSK